eukprot:jgi/Botrbrau1/16604/Bobra.0068s0032.1
MYKWRHDSVLSTIFSALSSFLSNISHDSEDSTYTSFVKEEQKQGLNRSHPGTSVPRRKLRCGSLGNFQDWLMVGDALSCPYQIPHSIVVTALRPDIFTYSASARKCILIELTVPFEDRVFIAAAGKANKYFELQTQIISAGYECELYVVEIGCRGNYAASLHHCLTQLELPRRHARRVCSCATKTALSCSYYIFLKRNNSLWEV